MFEVLSREKSQQTGEKDCYQRVEHVQVPNGTRLGFQSNECPLSTCNIHVS